MFVSNGDGTATDARGNVVPLTAVLAKGVSADAFVSTTRTADTTADTGDQPVLEGLAPSSGSPGDADKKVETPPAKADANAPAPSVWERLRSLTTTQKIIGAAALFALAAWLSSDDEGDDEGSDD